MDATYEWHFLTRFPPEYLKSPFAMELFRGWIEEAAQAINGFTSRLREAGLLAIDDIDVGIVRRGLQCLAFVGTRDDLQRLTILVQHQNLLVANDAKTCLFEITHRN